MNLTVTIDNDVLKRARIRAIMEETSVNAVVREFLATYAGAAGPRRVAVDRLLTLSGTATSGRGAAKWTRDELHDR